MAILLHLEIPMSSTETILAGVCRDLARTRGRWTEVAKDSGVPYHTLVKIAQGAVTDPRIGTIQLLVDYFGRPNTAAAEPAQEASHG